MVNVNDECLVFYIFWLQTMTKSTWKILKLDWKTTGYFFLQNSGNPVEECNTCIILCSDCTFVFSNFVDIAVVLHGDGSLVRRITSDR